MGSLSSSPDHIIDPHEVERQVVMAFVLEPLADKEGNTTRFKDLSEDLSLTNLQAAGVNVGRYFYELAERVSSAGGQPRSFFDLLPQAVRASLDGMRLRKYISFGLLELLFPVVLSRLVAKGDGVAVCQALPDILKRSSERDVVGLEEGRSLAWTTSVKKVKREYARRLGAKNLYEHHERNRDYARGLNYEGTALWSEQLLAGLPIVQEMYQEAREHLGEGILRAGERAHQLGLARMNRGGIIADYGAATLYLVLTEEPQRPLI